MRLTKEKKDEEVAMSIDMREVKGKVGDAQTIRQKDGQRAGPIRQAPDASSVSGGKVPLAPITVSAF